MTEADLRRSRTLCRVAAAVFAACGIAILFILPASLPVRAIAAGLNVIIAVAVLLYAGTLRADP